MSLAFLIQVGVSALAVAAMVALAAWAKIARPLAPLDEAQARALLADDFPGRGIEAVWVASDGNGALAKAGSEALVLTRLGDGYAARHIPWAQAAAAPARDGRITLQLADPAAPRAVLAMAAWPPKDLAA